MIWVQLALAVVAAGATIVAAWYAREAARAGRSAVDAAQTTIELTKQAVEAARGTIELTERAHREDERDRRRRRLERVGELVEEVFWESNSETQSGPRAWMPARNELRHALVGLQEQLPQCVDVVNASRSAEQAFAMASRARGEVEQALRELDASIPAEPRA